MLSIKIPLLYIVSVNITHAILSPAPLKAVLLEHEDLLRFLNQQLPINVRTALKCHKVDPLMPPGINTCT